MRITLENLTVTYERHPAIHHVSGTFTPGSLVAVIGPNGAGKSTLIKTIAGLIPSYEGMINRDGLTAEDIAYLPQIQELDKSFAISVIDLAMMGYWKKFGIARAYSAAMRAKAISVLEYLNLRDFADRAINTLSAGQFQRALFARTIIQDAKLILLDEPFNALDGKASATMMNIMRRWKNEGRIVVAVVHDMQQVKDNFDETILLARKCLAWGKMAEVLTESNLAKARNMMEKWDEDAEICEAVA